MSSVNCHCQPNIFLDLCAGGQLLVTFWGSVVEKQQKKAPNWSHQLSYVCHMCLHLWVVVNLCTFAWLCVISEGPLSNHSKNTAGLCHGAAILITTEFNLLYLIENKMRRLCFALLEFRKNKRDSVLSLPSPTAPNAYCIQWRKMRFGSATMR